MCYLKMWTEIPFGELIQKKNIAYKGWDFPENSRLNRISGAGYDEGIDVLSGGIKFH